MNKTITLFIFLLGFQSYLFSQKTTTLMDINSLPDIGSKVNSQNAFLPGYGTYLVSSKKHHKYMAVVFYSLIGSGAFFQYRASSLATSFTNSKTIDEANKYYESSINNRTIGYALFGTAVGVWAFEMIRGNVILSKKRKEIKKYQNEFLSFSIFPTTSINRTYQPQFNLNIRATF